MQIAKNIYKVIYEPEAYAEEDPTKDVRSEFIRKRRITANGFQSIVILRDILNPFKYGVLSFQYFSHRFLRWAAVPFLLPIAFISNLILSINDGGIYNLIMLLQIMFYLFTATDYVLEKYKVKIKIFNRQLYFSIMNFAAIAGFVRFITGKQNVGWERVSR